ncbi:nitrogen fixation protein FixH [Echinicola strongylocentroti]|uniref:Nitrogen fixation protein FixH n=1 Tax=Echinicola strongylocentroti TaxID=1795355 RepID=A0A2Z4IPB1_9BACT|nr:FixH family protein [Echinicola strongylocentroti]AWW32386.1 nitrogen fixation protein FixH [Echinicola strongylocentroti]
MNWGTGIVLFFVVFVSFLFTMVGICMKQDDLHLVTNNYYEEEIKYQEQIEKASNAAMLDHEVMAFDVGEKKIMVHLEKGAKGTLWLFRPSDARLDQKVPLLFDTGKEQSVSLRELKSGYWKVKLAWEKDGVAFYEEKKITL